MRRPSTPSAARRARRRGRGRDDRGTSLVEFALVLPVFALMLFGLVDFGLVFGGYVSLESQVNAAARAIAVGRISPSSSWPSGCPSTTLDLCTAAGDIGSGLLGVVPNTAKVEIYYGNDGTTTQGSYAVVCAQAATKSTSGLTSSILDGRTVRASSQVLLEVDAKDQLPSGQNYVSWPTGTVLSWCGQS